MIIVTAADDKYVPGVIALIYSTWLQNEVSEFHVLDNGISKKNKAKLRALAKRIGQEISLIDVSGSAIATLGLPDDRLTVSAFARLLIPELFKHHERVMYLDCDMLVLGDLRSAYETDFAGMLAAAVPDYGPGAEELKDLGIPLEEYFNSGLLVFNIPAWRAAKISETCFERASAKVFLYHDQSVLNAVCHNRVAFLPEDYNIFVDVPHEIRREERVKDIRVLHFVGRNKPWLVAQTDPKDPATIYGELWNEHARGLGDIISLPEPQATLAAPSLTKRLSIAIRTLNRRRRMWMGKMVGKEKYILRARADDFVQNFLPHIQSGAMEKLQRAQRQKI